MTARFASDRGRLLFVPDEERVARSRLTEFVRHLEASRGLTFRDYAELHRWSVTELAEFWKALAEFFAVEFTHPPSAVLADAGPLETSAGTWGPEGSSARWFPGAELNYAAHALRRADGLALIERDESGRREWTHGELADAVARCRAALLRMGVRRGDRVAGLLPNSAPAVIAFLAVASLGAIWSSCPPEFGVDAVLDRFQQIEPRVLIASDGYRYGGREHDRSAEVRAIRAALPSLVETVLLPRDASAAHAGPTFEELLRHAPEPGFEALPFDHPLFILYSSGTTGKPKAIVHSHGGILLEHYKALGLHHDLGPSDRFFWFSTTGWMMWNYLVSGLLVGSTIVLYDGSPAHPNLEALWRLADEEAITLFGTSAPFIMTCKARSVKPNAHFRFEALRAVGSTGAPLPREGFEWVHDAVKADVQLASISGGTDVCTAFLLGSPWSSVRAGELSCAALGAAVAAYDPEGWAIRDDVGELVIEQPMPSMPVSFWNDPDGARLRASYFERFPGVWHHGDWLCHHTDGSAVIFGRSDATLNRGGVRMGTSEFYQVVEAVSGVVDSLVVDTTSLDHGGKLWLFVVLAPGADRGQVFRDVKAELRRRLSPRHVPDVLCAIEEVPYTSSGKKVEVPVKRLLMGATLQSAVTPGSLRNPEAIEALLRRASEQQTKGAP